MLRNFLTKQKGGTLASHEDEESPSESEDISGMSNESSGEEEPVITTGTKPREQAKKGGFGIAEFR